MDFPKWMKMRVETTPIPRKIRAFSVHKRIGSADPRALRTHLALRMSYESPRQKLKSQCLYLEWSPSSQCTKEGIRKKAPYCTSIHMLVRKRSSTERRVPVILIAKTQMRAIVILFTISKRMPTQCSSCPLRILP